MLARRHKRRGRSTQLEPTGRFSLGMRLAALTALVACLTFAASTEAVAKPPLELGIQDDALFVREPGTYDGQHGKLISRDAAYNATRKLSVRVVRINVIWTHVAGIKKSHPWN